MKQMSLSTSADVNVFYLGNLILKVEVKIDLFDRKLSIAQYFQLFMAYMTKFNYNFLNVDNFLC